MKSFIILITIFFLSTVASLEFKCPQPYLSELKPIKLDSYLGVWYSLRATPCEEGVDAACITSVLWKEKENPTGVKCVVSVQANGTTEYMEANATVIPISSEPGKVDRHFIYDMMNMTMTSVFVDSDDGQNWAIEHTCFDLMGNATSMWSVLSRHRQIDAKLEQDLVEKIEKYSGLTQDKLKGIRQTDCHAN